jgi:hypothetical protein
VPIGALSGSRRNATIQAVRRTGDRPSIILLESPSIIVIPLTV